MASFKNSPLAQFVSEPATAEKQTPHRRRSDADRARIAAENAQYKDAPKWKTRAPMDNAEPRSRRVQLLMKPSIYEALQEIASVNAKSINNLMEEAARLLIEDYKA